MVGAFITLPGMRASEYAEDLLRFAKGLDGAPSIFSKETTEFFNDFGSQYFMHSLGAEDPKFLKQWFEKLEHAPNASEEELARDPFLAAAKKIPPEDFRFLTGNVFKDTMFRIQKQLLFNGEFERVLFSGKDFDVDAAVKKFGLDESFGDGAGSYRESYENYVKAAVHKRETEIDHVLEKYIRPSSVPGSENADETLIAVLANKTEAEKEDILRQVARDMWVDIQKNPDARDVFMGRKTVEDIRKAHEERLAEQAKAEANKTTPEPDAGSHEDHVGQEADFSGLAEDSAASEAHGKLGNFAKKLQSARGEVAKLSETSAGRRVAGASKLAAVAAAGYGVYLGYGYFFGDKEDKNAPPAESSSDVIAWNKDAIKDIDDAQSQADDALDKGKDAFNGLTQQITVMKDQLNDVDRLLQDPNTSAATRDVLQKIRPQIADIVDMYAAYNKTPAGLEWQEAAAMRLQQTKGLYDDIQKMDSTSSLNDAISRIHTMRTDVDQISMMQQGAQGYNSIIKSAIANATASSPQLPGKPLNADIEKARKQAYAAVLKGKNEAIKAASTPVQDLNEAKLKSVTNMELTYDLMVRSQASLAAYDPSVSLDDLAAFIPNAVQSAKAFNDVVAIKNLAHIDDELQRIKTAHIQLTPEQESDFRLRLVKALGVSDAPARPDELSLAITESIDLAKKSGDTDKVKNLTVLQGELSNILSSAKVSFSGDFTNEMAKISAANTRIQGISSSLNTASANSQLAIQGKALQDMQAKLLAFNTNIAFVEKALSEGTNVAQLKKDNVTVPPKGTVPGQGQTTTAAPAGSAPGASTPAGTTPTGSTPGTTAPAGAAAPAGTRQPAEIATLVADATLFVNKVQTSAVPDKFRQDHADFFRQLGPGNDLRSGLTQLAGGAAQSQSQLNDIVTKIQSLQTDLLHKGKSGEANELQHIVDTIHGFQGQLAEDQKTLSDNAKQASDILARMKTYTTPGDLSKAQEDFKKIENAYLKSVPVAQEAASFAERVNALIQGNANIREYFREKTWNEKIDGGNGILSGAVDGGQYSDVIGGALSGVKELAAGAYDKWWEIGKSIDPDNKGGQLMFLLGTAGLGLAGVGMAREFWNNTIGSWAGMEIKGGWNWLLMGGAVLALLSRSGNWQNELDAAHNRSDNAYGGNPYAQKSYASLAYGTPASKISFGHAQSQNGGSNLPHNASGSSSAQSVPIKNQKSGEHVDIAKISIAEDGNITVTNEKGMVVDMSKTDIDKADFDEFTKEEVRKLIDQGTCNNVPDAMGMGRDRVTLQHGDDTAAPDAVIVEWANCKGLNAAAKNMGLQ